MGKWMRRIVMGLLLAVFVLSAGSIAVIQRQYQADETFYIDAAQRYLSVQKQKENMESGYGDMIRYDQEETAPIRVDFVSLQAVNSDVIGWIYCEDTVINYPILKGADNDIYLHRTYEGGYSKAGSIFVDAANQWDFADSNTIVYGHHMNNGSMFASLQDWLGQEFYEKHPVMWLLTPQQDYKIVLFSGYTVSAYSDTYTIFTGPCEEFTDYLAGCVERSAFHADVELNEKGCYVLLSTCAYMFENARYVLHGMLVPVNR